MSDETCIKKVREYLHVGNATTDALRQWLGAEVSGPQFERVMARLELAGEICRGTWGVLPVWKGSYSAKATADKEVWSDQ